MNPFSTADCRHCEAGCPQKYLCRCLRVTEAMVVQAIETFGLRTLPEVRQHTGAGDGCACCQAKIRRLLERHDGKIPMPMAVAG